MFNLVGTLKDENNRIRLLNDAQSAKNLIHFKDYNTFCKNYMNFSAPGSAKRFKMKMAESEQLTELQTQNPKIC